MIRLLKTTGGSNGSPAKCSSCGNGHFIKSGIAWHCSDCFVYCPAKLVSGISEDIKKLIALHKEFRRSIDDLEHLVRE